MQEWDERESLSVDGCLFGVEVQVRPRHGRHSVTVRQRVAVSGNK